MSEESFKEGNQKVRKEDSEKLRKEQNEKLRKENKKLRKNNVVQN